MDQLGAGVKTLAQSLAGKTLTFPSGLQFRIVSARLIAKSQKFECVGEIADIPHEIHIYLTVSQANDLTNNPP